MQGCREGIGEGPSPPYGASDARGVGFAANLGNQPQAPTFRRVYRFPFGKSLEGWVCCGCLIKGFGPKGMQAAAR